MTTDVRSARLRVRAFAKINLSLEVLGVRPDGYHDLRTIFQSIELHDLLSFSPTTGPFDIRCDDPACPVDRTNLIWRAAQLVWRAGGRRGSPRGVRVRLRKNIPMQSGLGGGSSDAAAALVALARIWRISLSPQQRARLARKLGADVAFFLQGGTALGEGTGERVTSLADEPRSWVVLIVPEFGVNTREAYGWWDQDGGKPRASGKVGNDLQAPVARQHPEISEIVAELDRAGASRAAMSGSGSAVFGLFPTRADAMSAARRLETGSRRVIVSRTVARREFEAGGLPGKVSIG